MCSSNTHEDPNKSKQEPKSKNKYQNPRTKNQMMLNTQDLPCFGALEEGKTPTAALAYSLIMWKSQVQRCSLSCMEEQRCSSLRKKNTRGGE